MNQRQAAQAFVATIVRDFPAEDAKPGALTDRDHDTLTASLFLKFREHGLLKPSKNPMEIYEWGNAVTRAWRDYPPSEDDGFAEGWLVALRDLITLN